MRIRTLFAIFAIFAAVLGVAAQKSRAQTGTDFYSQCGNGFTAGFVNRGYCHSYITGLVNGVAASGNLICLPPGVTDTQLVMIAQNYMRRHPEELNESANAVIVRSAVNAYPCPGLEQSTKVKLHNVATALELFKLDVGRYPTEQEGLIALVRTPVYPGKWKGPYLRSESGLYDPWGHLIQYRMPGERSSFDLFSNGPDSQYGARPISIN